jgi:hypothetical protein
MKNNTLVNSEEAKKFNENNDNVDSVLIQNEEDICK